ncbi:MAG: L,D-transpeptidase family protein [Sphingobium sp.]|jgi:lipoprotein-anchoring transpeptidase ErfK/SrfK|nr:L,D-transpeptidase family protein [Sphingobium sp.]MCI1270126.1 L,D-transpeptidase family protein [Sphingobium sp.]MCI1754947.1 L,D-transpeptidase family protein [Sphingobium sp.]MCI2051692.1 L,D-transpeptidase family protein [Sphingobium sp.]
MPKRTISKAKAQKIFVGTMAGAMALTLGVASRGFFQGSSAEAPKPVPAKAPNAEPRLASPHKSAPLPKIKTPAAADATAPSFVVKRVLDIPGPLDHGDYVWNDAGVPAGPMVVTVDLKAQTLSVFRGGYEIGVAVILYGATDKPTPLGTYPILEKDKDHFSSLYDNAPMPYSLRLTQDGVFIHASDVQWGNATHGCIGLPLPFAKKLFAVMKVGDPVVVTNGKRMDLSGLR